MHETHPIVPFCYESNSVRVVQIAGEPWFVVKDVCSILGLANPSVAVASLDDDERAKKSLGRQGDTWIISESGLYTLIIRSNKAEAKPFRRWVTKEVLPQIRRTGSYSLPSTHTDLAAIISGAVRKEFAAERSKRRKIEPWLLDMIERTPREKVDFLYVALPMAYAGVSFHWTVQHGAGLSA